MAYDAARRTVVLMVGSIGSSLVPADFWDWKGERWERLDPLSSLPPSEAPAARRKFDAAGHYPRPDVLTGLAHRSPHAKVITVSKDDQVKEFREAMESAARWHNRTPIEQAEFDRSAAGAFPGGPDLIPGDWILHPEEGRCQVLSIEESIVKLAVDGGNMDVDQDTCTFVPEAIEEGGIRVFSMSAKPRL